MKLRISKGGRGKQMKKKAENLSDALREVTPNEIYASPELQLSDQLHATSLIERVFSNLSERR
jgi:hypothetical protein